MNKMLGVVCAAVMLQGCNEDEYWRPVVDVHNAELAQWVIEFDLDECRNLAIQVGEMNKWRNPSAYRNAYSSCMAQRGHIVLNNM